MNDNKMESQCYFKYLKYLNSVSGINRSFAVEYKSFYIWLDTKYSSQEKENVIIIIENLKRENIPYIKNIDDYWIKIIVKITDIQAKLRNDKINSILK